MYIFLLIPKSPNLITVVCVWLATSRGGRGRFRNSWTKFHRSVSPSSWWKQLLSGHVQCSCL